MQIGVVGLGGTGANMARRWLETGHACVGYARNLADVEASRGDTIDGFLGEVSDSGEGRWTVNTAVEVGAAARK